MTTNETYAQKRRRLHGGIKRAQYLAEVNSVLWHKIDATALLSIVESDELIKGYPRSSKEQTYVFKFSDKELLGQLLAQVYERWPNATYYLLTADYDSCGIVKGIQLMSFNMLFEFYDLLCGQITFWSADQTHSIYIDWYEEFGQELMEVIVSDLNYSNEPR